MNPIIYHLVSGQAFFSGLLLIVLTVLISMRKRRPPRAAGRLTVLIGALLVGLSSTPGSWWLYGTTAGLLAAWCLGLAPTDRTFPVPAALVAACCGLSALELPWHVAPALAPLATNRIAIIGDSITAGYGGDDTSERWPVLIRQRTGAQITDFSHVGETAASALGRIRHQPLECSLVVVEIGGNDILGSTSVEEFDVTLDALLKHLANDNRSILMFELPLPPMYHGYGAVQRRLSRRYHVTLIPKRTFLQVIANQESTSDSIHLTQDGHNRMANALLLLIEPALPGPRTER